MRLRPNHLCQALRPRSEHFLMALVTARPSSRVPAETTWEWERRMSSRTPDWNSSPKTPI
jgi:hypothetical protein